MKVVQSFGKRVPVSTIRISLCDISDDMTDAWLDGFVGLEAVEILQGDLMEAGTEAVVSPANSFGDMSGGVDKRIDDFYKGAAQKAITERIREEHWGELPVGMAILVGMPSSGIPFVVAAPTMRVPGDVANTVNAYLAMRAALVAVLRHNAGRDRPIASLAVPGLCTGMGRMPCAAAARQMRAAYDNIIGGGWKDIAHPAMAPFALGSKAIDWRRET